MDRSFIGKISKSNHPPSSPMMIILRFDIILDDLESLSNRTMIIRGSPKVISNLSFELREFLAKKGRRGTFELHCDFTGRKLRWIFEEYMDMLWIHSHPNYSHIHLFGNFSDYLLTPYRNLTIQQWSSEFRAENHMISEHRDRMAVMTQVPAFVFLIYFGFHKGPKSVVKGE